MIVAFLLISFFITLAANYFIFKTIDEREKPTLNVYEAFLIAVGILNSIFSIICILMISIVYGHNDAIEYTDINRESFFICKHPDVVTFDGKTYTICRVKKQGEK